MFNPTEAASDGLHLATGAPAILIATAIDNPAIWLTLIQILAVLAFRAYQAHLNTKKEIALESAREAARVRAEAEETARARRSVRVDYRLSEGGPTSTRSAEPDPAEVFEPHRR